MSIGAGSGFLTPVQQGQSPSLPPDRAEQDLAPTPPLLAIPTPRPPSWGLSPGLGVDGVRPVPLLFPLTQGLRIPTAWSGRGTLAETSESRAVIQTGDVQACFILVLCPSDCPSLDSPSPASEDLAQLPGFDVFCCFPTSQGLNWGS